MVYSLHSLQQIIQPLLVRYHAQYAILFGSYAREEAHAASDIDLVVAGGKEFDPTDVFCIADELYRITGKNVDVYELCEIEPDSPFYHAIMQEGVKIA